MPTWPLLRVPLLLLLLPLLLVIKAFAVAAAILCMTCK